MEDAEPQGLNLSLDDIIKQSRNQGGVKHHPRAPPRDHGDRGGGGGGPTRRRHTGPPPRADRGGFHGGPAPRSRGFDYRSRQKCFIEEDTGTVVFEYRGVPIVRITPAGDVTLDCAGYHNQANISSLNDALNPIGIRVTAPSGDVTGGQWSVSDGKSLVRFSDGVILGGKGAVGRGRAVLEAFANPNRGLAAAAQARSDAAAAGAGMVHGFVPPPGAYRRGGGRGGRGRGGGGGGGGPRYAPY